MGEAVAVLSSNDTFGLGHRKMRQLGGYTNVRSFIISEQTL